MPANREFNQNKYLVTAVEANGFVRGQATKSIEEAKKLFDHFKENTDCQFAEIRRIGSQVEFFQAPERLQ